MIPGKRQTTPINVLLVGNSQCPATALWKDYDPNDGDFQEEIVNQENRDGVFHRDSYISAYVLGEEVRVYCRYSVKAVVAYFGIGHNDYYRDKQVWLYNVPYVEPSKSPGEEINLASVAPEAYVPWSFAIQARGHHDTEKIGQDTRFWLEKHVLGNEVEWPEHPQSVIRLDADGVPELVVTPASPDKARKVEMFYALKNPTSFARSWRDIVELEITASDEWQEMTISPERLIHPVNQRPLPDWSSVGKLHFQPKPGSDLTKVLFAEFKWVKHNQESDSKSKANPR